MSESIDFSAHAADWYEREERIGAAVIAMWMQSSGQFDIRAAMADVRARPRRDGLIAVGVEHAMWKDWRR